MVTFYYDRFSKENINSQWIRYLQNNAYINEIDSIVSQNRRELEKSIEDASDEQKKAIQNVCGTLEDGFREVNQHLADINFNVSELRSEINEMASMLDWKLSLMIDQQKVTNELLGIISHLERIPDSQKQRVYYLERGLKYLKNAIIEGVESDFYVKSLENFKEAEKIEDDFITLSKIGQIYLYSKKYLNISLAEEYFLKSAKEAFAEANVGGTTISNYLRPFGHHSHNYSQNPFKAASAEAYLYAGRACYLQQNLTEAAEWAGKAYDLIPEFLKAGYEQAKYLAANGQDEEAASVLQRVINKNRYFSITALEEEDFKDRPAILKLLDYLKIRALTRATDELQQCTEIIRKDSEAYDKIGEIQALISKESFLSAMKALDLLHADYQFPYNLYVNNGKSIIRTTLTTQQKLIDFIKAENDSETQFEEVKKECKKAIIADRKFICGMWGGSIGLVTGFFRSCTVRDFSIDPGILFGTLILCAVLGVIVGYLVGVSESPRIE